MKILSILIVIVLSIILIGCITPTPGPYPEPTEWNPYPSSQSDQAINIKVNVEENNMFNIIEFLKDAAISFPAVLPIVMAIVTFLGKFGVEGKAQLIASLITGLVLGVLVMYFTAKPTEIVGWFSMILFGLITGLAASGCYDVLKTATKKT
jgi:uncharacterized membrane protein YeaQ/YmgE (transglycosylase-associated protein family)